MGTPEDTVIGRPLVPGATVKLFVEQQTKDKKVDYNSACCLAVLSGISTVDSPKEVFVFVMLRCVVYIQTIRTAPMMKNIKFGVRLETLYLNLARIMVLVILYMRTLVIRLATEGEKGASIFLHALTYVKCWLQQPQGVCG